MRISLSQAQQALQAGQVIAVPTETVYGLAARLDRPEAIAQIFALKKRSLANPLIIHVAHLKDIDPYVSTYPPQFNALAEAFWPGALTCILPIDPNKVPGISRSHLETAGFRMPCGDLTQRLLEQTGPLVMPSANLSGRPSATRPEHVEEDFGKDFPVLEGGGACQKGVESTILLYQAPQWVIVRLGALSPETFLPVLGYIPRFVQQPRGTQPLCPGQAFRHYAPKAHLLLRKEQKKEINAFAIGFKERNYPTAKRVLFLGSLFNPEEVAENLYQILRQLDQEKATEAWVDMDFPRQGLWQTIAERLERAGEQQ